MKEMENKHKSDNLKKKKNHNEPDMQTEKENLEKVLEKINV